MEKLLALMADSQLDLTGNPVAAWRYRTRALTLGRSWALRAAGVVGGVGRKDETGLSSGRREKRDSLAPVVSLHPLSRMVLLSFEKTVTTLLSNKTVQL